MYFVFLLTTTSCYTIFADEFGVVPPVTELYAIYSIHTNEVLFTAEYVEVGDEYISKNNVWYEVISVDYSIYTAYAKFKMQLYLPPLTSGTITHTATQQVIGLYHTHNAESFVPTDGTDSYYGAGGIHDVGKALSNALPQNGIDVYYNETLHLPHTSSAYTRSRVTAQSLLNTLPNPSAIFDIHRDALPKSSYSTTINGTVASKIRIVVGKSNPNYAYNLEFALKIKAAADNLYSELIKDIYMGKNLYNQDLCSQALIFECGTYLIEKEAVINSMPLLANVINETLFKNSVSGDILISDDLTDNADIPPAGSDTDTTFTVDTDLDTINNSNLTDNTKIIIITLFFIFIVYILIKGKKHK